MAPRSVAGWSPCCPWFSQACSWRCRIQPCQRTAAAEPPRERSGKRFGSRTCGEWYYYIRAVSISLHRRIVHGLGRQILSGKLLPGQAVPVPAGLTASRTALREAMKVLTAKGLVEARPRVGTRVRSRAHWQLFDQDVIAWQRGGKLGAAFLNELTEVREILEPATAAL